MKTKTITKEQYDKLKAEVDEAKDRAQRAEGALELCKKKLKEDHGCETIKEARKLLKDTEEALEKANASYVAAETQYRQTWKQE